MVPEFISGLSTMALAWTYTLRSVRIMVLRKDNRTLSIVTYAPFNKNSYLDVPLEKVRVESLWLILREKKGCHHLIQISWPPMALDKPSLRHHSVL